jgi:hypothetical protein
MRGELLTTIEELAAFGEKRCGTEAGQRAAEYLYQRLRHIGLEGVGEQPFAFPRHDLAHAAFELWVAGTERQAAWAVLEGCGAGNVDGELINVGWATAEQLAELPSLRGKIAIIDRNPLYHRSTQYYNAAAAGAAAVVFASTAPANLPQVGSVRRSWEASGPIPALAIGGTDAHVLRAALEAHQTVRARLDVETRITRAVGRNIVGRIPGLGSGEIVVGAHYDSWFAGSSDNGGGVAALLALAERRAGRAPARHGLVFVAWDGEELALYGGYHLLRRYALAGRLPLAVIDFETPSALGAQAYGLARSNHAPLEDAIVSVGLHELFALNVPMDLVAELFGGIIPTDIQGFYRSAAPAMATAVDAPYYHTVEDTPDKVDLARLEETVLAFDRALDSLMTVPPERFSARDPALWRVALDVRARGEDLAVTVEVRDAGGRPQSNATIEVVLFEDDFFAVASRRALSDAAGTISVDFAGAAVSRAPRFLHVSAGGRWPLAEAVRPL